MGLRDEIREQPEVAARLLRDGRPEIEAIADRLIARLADREIDHVVIAARGTSDHAAIYAQYLFGAHLRLPVALATPSLISLYGVEPRLDRSLVIGVSQSGQSPDIVGVVAAARRQGAPTIALTNDAGSDLAAAAEHHIDLRAGPERAVAATKTYTAELLAIALLVTALEARLNPTAGRDAALAAVPDALAGALDTEPAAEAVARHLAGRDRLIVVGRGFNYATAREMALKLKELARLAADPYSAADFLHGPLVLVEPGYPVIVLAPVGPDGGRHRRPPRPPRRARRRADRHLRPARGDRSRQPRDPPAGGSPGLADADRRDRARPAPRPASGDRPRHRPRIAPLDREDHPNQLGGIKGLDILLWPCIMPLG